jgi:hypothetical protein
MSNYPPGVTGNEFQIAGPDKESDEVRTCGKEGVTVLTVSDLDVLYLERSIEMLRADNAAKHPNAVTLALQRLHQIKSSIEDVEVVKCPFEGLVTVIGYQGVASWTCPLCREEHDEEYGDE